MHLVDFPGCCTAKIVTGFGQTGYGERRYAPNRILSVDEIVSFLKKQVTFLLRRGDIAILYATTNSEQSRAEEALKAVGFVPTEAVSKNQHRDVKLTGWHLILGNKPVEPEKDIKADLPPGFIQKAPVEAVRKPHGGFQVGDIVRVAAQVNKEIYRVNRDLGWNNFMDPFMGTTGRVIIDRGHGFLRVDHGEKAWSWFESDLTLVSRNGRDAKGRFVKKV